MKNKLTALLLAAALLALTGCQLARPEKTDAERFGDRFAGIYAVYDDGESWVTDENMTESGAPDTKLVNRSSFWSSDNPLLTEMGQETLDTGKYGNISVPKLVLIGEYDEETHEYIFPGLEGFALFVTHNTDANGPYTACESDMADATFHLTSTDQGEMEEIEGTLYLGPPLGAGPDWNEYREDRVGGVWHHYNVYQREDGTVYLDGSGNSYGGNNSGGSSATHTDTRKTAMDGEVTEITVSVTVNMKITPRLTRLTVTQFDGKNQILKAEDLPLQSDLRSIDCLDSAAWVLVEEVSDEGTERALYNVPGEEDQPVCHQIILLDDAGVGSPAQLTIKP